MASYGVAEAKNKFTRLLERVEAGESITITRHGKPIAEMKAAPAVRSMRSHGERRTALEAFAARRDTQPPIGISTVDLIRQMRDEGY